MRVIATAGHVDHGKSTLVQALTGINPDRLAEEQARQMTIDLGFAWLTLADGETVGIVDVPGHEDFIENMLAGVGGIDVGVLVIAADEGIMPQTREHLAILDLLNIPRLMVALTKIDLVTDPEWRDLVILDIEERLETTRFQNAPIMPVSAQSGEGLADFLAILSHTLATLEPPILDGTPRLPIDRVFTLTGFGTVVTGTLLDGTLGVGETVEILPDGIQGRIRGIQSHNQDIESAVAGSRVAVNLAGIDKQSIKRGDILTRPNYIRPTLLIDVHLQLLKDAPRPLKHNAEVKLFVGPSEATGRVRLLTNNNLNPGQAGWAQIQLDNPLALLRGQRYILRYPSPPATIGGGLILAAAPGRKWKRNRPPVLERFERLMRGTPLDLMREVLIHNAKPLTITQILKIAGLASTVIDLEHLPSDIRLWQGEWLIHEDTLQQYANRADYLLGEFHRQNPLLHGMPRQSLITQLHLDEQTKQVVMPMLQNMGVFAISNQRFVHLPSFKVRYSRAQQSGILSLENAFSANPYTPPSFKEAVEILGSEAVLAALISQGDLIRISDDVILAPTVYQEWVAFARETLEAGHTVKLSEFRDRFNTSRKYALAFLDHLAAYHITRRVNDEHQRGRGDWAVLELT